MTARAPAWFEAKYVDGAIHQLQTAGYLLQGLFAMAIGRKGNTVTWKVAGQGEATEMSDAIEDRPVLNADRTTVTATLKDYEANEWIKTTDLTKMSEAEIQLAQKTCAMAVGRRYDKVAIGALDADGTVALVGDGTTQISPLDLLGAQADILDTGVAGTPILNVIATRRQLAQLLTYRELASSDFVDDRPLLKQIGARQWLGMRLIPVPSSYLNNPVANARDGYMWIESAAGFATNTDAKGNIDLATRIDYVPTKKAYFAGNTMSAAATTILPAGIKRLRFLDTKPTTRPTP